MHTKDPKVSSCPDECREEGVPLRWGPSQLTYTFNERGFPGLHDDELRAIIADSFGAWESVSCGETRVNLSSSATGDTTTLWGGEPADDAPNKNVIAHLSAEEWSAEGYSHEAHAITLVWFAKRTGEIHGADILFNGAWGEYGTCSEAGCTGSDPENDLANVATHEIGHFLGLAHSDQRDSTMWCNAPSGEVSKRELSEDDVAGICAAYGQGPPDRKDQALTARDGGCSAGAAHGGGFSLAALLLLTTLMVRVRRQDAGAG